VNVITNLEKYKNCFAEAFALADDADIESLKYQAIPEWDSVGHMALMALLEEKFEVLMDTDDIIDFSSYEAGREIMKKYDVIV
jgi:acyl carrier protein